MTNSPIYANVLSKRAVPSRDSGGPADDLIVVGRKIAVNILDRISYVK